MSFVSFVRTSPWFRWVAAGSIALLVILGAVLAHLLLPVRVDSISLDRTELTFTSLTETYLLTVETKPSGIRPTKLQWASSDPSVAIVTREGRVIPLGEGETTVSVRGDRGDGAAECLVRVSAVSALTLHRHELVLLLNRSQTLLYTVSPSGADTSGLVWTSSDPAVASVDRSGLVTAISPGTATVTLSTADGAFSDSCAVTVVEDVPVEGIAFTVTDFLFDSQEDTLVLEPVFTPVTTSQRELQWISTNPAVATVNEKGEVTPISNGETTIIAKSVFGEISASCTVTVDLNIPLKGISLPAEGYTFTGLKQTYRIVPVFDPFNASNQKIAWTSSHPEVASVSADGLVTSLKKGSATIRLVTEEGGFTAEFKVTVAPSDHVAVTGVKLSSYEVRFSAIGETHQISASVLPANATEKRLVYTSKNTSVATVSSSGVVTGKGYGTTQITVTSVEGGYSENFTVSVTAPAPEVPEAPSPVVSGEYVKGVWVASVANINFPSKSGLSADQLKAEIDAIMENTAKMGLNTVYFQVRPCGDALYPSEYYPSSAYVVGTQGNGLPLDILAYAVESAHARGLALHAWINPYRVTQNTTSTDKLAASNPARKNPSWVISDGKKLYLNPGLPEVRQYIINGVMEIVNKYDVDGIHFDDYFYPNELGSWDDSAAYAAYGNGLSLADWRRANNDALVKGVYDAIKAKTSEVSFGISPAGVWSKKSTVTPEGTEGIGNTLQTYSQGFADTRKWVKNGWLDYICPQVYWQIDHSVAPFKPIVSWWNDTVAGTGVDLYIGIAAYKCGGSDKVTAYASGTEIPAQLDYMDSLENVNGAVFYNYGSLVSNYAGIKDTLTARYYKQPISTTLQFIQPSMTLDRSFLKTYIVGVSDPNYPLYADGKLVSRTTDGYFAYEATLSGSGRTVRFTHKGQTVDYVIKQTATSTGSGTTMNAFGFVPGSFTPAYDTGNQSGTEIQFSCQAPAGSDVTVTVGTLSIKLTTTTKDPGNKYLKATYTGTLTLPQIDGNGNATLGYVVFHASRKGESVTYSPGCLVEVLNTSVGMTVTKDKADIRPNLDVEPTLYYIATAGSRFNVVSKEGGLAKLSNGMYMSLAHLKSLDSSVSAGKMTSASFGVSNKYSVFSFGLTEAVFHTVWMDAEYAEITLYGVSGDLPALAVGENPLFSSVKMERIDGTTVRIVLTYRAAKHIYGYTCSFDGNTLYVNFRNPVTLSDSDRPLTGVVISIDPGHCNPRDPGAIRYYNGKAVYEADLNMKLSTLVGEKLRALGATVIFSHSAGCETYSLDATIAKFRESSPDLNISIHFNAVENNSPSATGTEAYWCYGNSRLLGEYMVQSFTQATGFKYRKVERGYYKVSRLCEFPSILLETAFLSNASDLAWFMNDANMETAATALADGLYGYFKEQSN